MLLPYSCPGVPVFTGVFTRYSAVLVPCPRRDDAVFYRVHAGVMVIVDRRDDIASKRFHPGRPR